MLVNILWPNPAVHPQLGSQTAKVRKAIREEFREFMRSIGKKPALTPTTESVKDLELQQDYPCPPSASISSTKLVIPSSPVSVAENPI